MNRTSVDLWVVDPTCPYVWMTSRGLLEVERLQPIRVHFHVMNLSMLHDGREGLRERYQRLLDVGRGPARVAIAAEQTRGPELARDLYQALGTRLHPEGSDISRALYLDALGEVGLPASLADAADSSEFDEALRARHHADTKPVGEDVGTPVIHTPGPDGQPIALFGPVVVPAQKGEAAGRLSDGVLLAASTDGFLEIQRTRTREPIFDGTPLAAGWRRSIRQQRRTNAGHLRRLSHSMM